jgi:multiple sugar transport system substrate-binding protein
MRINVRRIGLLVLVLLTLSLLAVSFAHAQVTSIRFGTVTGSFVDRVNQMMIDAFKAAHPDIEVKMEVVTDPNYGGALTAQAAAHTLPDVVFTADLYVVPFVQNKIVLDMQSFAEADSDINIDDVYPIMLDLGRVAGDPGLYMIPSSYDVVTLYYNKTMFEAAGAPLPTPDWTWDDLRSACITIKQQTDNFCVGNDSPKWWAVYVPWIVGYGGSLLADDGRTVMLSSPESLAGLTAMTDMWTKDGTGQPLDFDAGGNCFLVGKCAVWLMIAGPMNTLRAIDPQPFEWDVQVIPSHPKGKVTGMGTYGFAISADAQDPQLAWDFVKNLLSPEIQKAVALDYSGTPLLMSLANDPDILNRAPPPENINGFVENGKNGILPTYFPGECGSLYAGQISQLIGDALDAVLRGNQTVEEAFTFANDEIQACLDETITS